jgi:hypothetical protein
MCKNPRKKVQTENTEISAKFTTKKEKKQIPQQEEETRTNRHKNERKKERKEKRGKGREAALLLCFRPI